MMVNNSQKNQGRLRSQVGTFFSSLFHLIFLSSKGFPIVLSLTILSIFFVIFRMKSVEINYTFLKVGKETKDALEDNKELRAKMARMLSIKNLKLMAKENNLSEPTSDQIIVIPYE